MFKILVSDSLPTEILEKYNKTDGVEIVNKIGISMDDLKNEIGDIYDSADNERDRQLSHILNDRDRKKLIAIDEALAYVNEKHGTFKSEK